jgi:hypothetical protein
MAFFYFQKGCKMGHRELFLRTPAPPCLHHRLAGLFLTSLHSV